MRTGPATLIGGRWEDPGSHREVTDPADGTVVGRIGTSDAAGARDAAAAAAAAFPSWSATTTRRRADLLRAAAVELAGATTTIGALLSRETGKLVAEAEGEVRFAAEYFRWFAEEVRRPDGERLAAESDDRRQVTLRSPAGVAACLTPWNFPVSIQARKVAAALAAGCTVVARPSEKAPLAVVELYRILDRVGFPPGVANLVHGPAAEITDALLSHPAVRVVSFTGSTEVGRSLMAKAAARVVRPALELGGDAAFIVFDDADLDAAVDGAMVAKFRNNGQSCIAANRFLVHEAVVDDFTTRFAARVDAMRVGAPSSVPPPDLGPLIDRHRVAAVTELVEAAREAGGTLATRPRELPPAGTYAAPALLTDVPPDADLACTEVFGPVAAISPFTDEDDAVALANRTEMGLAGYAYTRDLSRALRLAERIEVGILGINSALPSVAYAPMGGVKQSGMGREGGRPGLEEFTDTRFVTFGM